MTGFEYPQRERDEILQELIQVERALQEARMDFETCMCDAHRLGCSLRDIAEAAGVSHETVRRIVLARGE